MTYPALQTVADGRADIAPDHFGFTYDRFRMVDFSPILRYSYVSIFYGKRSELVADPFRNVFDAPSYGFLAAGFILLTVTIWLALRREREISFIKFATQSFGHLFGQGFPDSVSRPCLRISRFSLILYMVTYTLIRAMYCSVFIVKCV